MLNNNSTVFLILAGITLTFSACSVTPYTKPTSGPTARLRVIADNSADYYAWSQDASRICGRESPNLKQLGGDTTPDQESVGLPDKSSPSFDRFERIVPANKPFKILVRTQRRVDLGLALFALNPVVQGQIQSAAWSCYGTVTFIPDSERSYELHYQFERHKCAVQLEELEAVSGQLNRKSIPVDFKSIGESTECNN